MTTPFRVTIPLLAAAAAACNRSPDRSARAPAPSVAAAPAPPRPAAPAAPAPAPAPAPARAGFTPPTPAMPQGFPLPPVAPAVDAGAADAAVGDVPPARRVEARPGMQAAVQRDGTVRLRGTDVWGNAVDTSYESCTFYVRALPVLRRTVTPAQMVALSRVCARAAP
jgi:hypothetical protein